MQIIPIPTGRVEKPLKGIPHDELPKGLEFVSRALIPHVVQTLVSKRATPAIGA